MNHLLRIVVILIALRWQQECLITALNIAWPIKELDYKAHPNASNYHILLKDIEKERPFDAVLIVGQSKAKEQILDGIYYFTAPKVIVSNENDWQYKTYFNSDILSVVILDQKYNFDNLELTATILQYMRQCRVLIIAMHIKDRNIFKAKLLDLCRLYKMTNVLLNFYDNSSNFLLMLKPYPLYHWKTPKPLKESNAYYYPQHWANMHNTSIRTITDKVVPRSLVFKDAQGNYHINGYVSKLILLFADHFNASLKMYQPLKEAATLHFIDINQMVKEDLLDLPMTTNPVPDADWLHSSTVYEIASGMLMVPCAQSLTTREVFGILLNLYFFGGIFMCTWLLSSLHTLIEYIHAGVVNLVSLLMSDKMLPGVLGQSFVARNLPSRSLKLLYLLVFLVGLNINTRFAANINTHLTRPPYHKQIATFDDLRNSKLKILINTAEVPILYHAIHAFNESVVFTNNGTYYLETRSNFNTSYGYFVPISMWEIFTRKQHFFTHKIFCTFEGLKIYDFLPTTIQLEFNSPFREPLDNLIHRVHDAGLKQAWHSSTFNDMLRLKHISIIDPYPYKGANVLQVNDLILVWLIAVVGLLASSLVFLVELCMGFRLRWF